MVREGVWAEVLDHRSGAFLGRIGLHFCPAWNEIELGYVLGKEAQGKGIAFEVLSAGSRLSHRWRRGPGRPSLLGSDELDRVEDGACLSRQRRIEPFVGLAHLDHSALAVQIDH